jgi:hypothetical protein
VPLFGWSNIDFLSSWSVRSASAVDDRIWKPSVFFYLVFVTVAHCNSAVAHNFPSERTRSSVPIPRLNLDSPLPRSRVLLSARLRFSPCSSPTQFLLPRVSSFFRTGPASLARVLRFGRVEDPPVQSGPFSRAAHQSMIAAARLEFFPLTFSFLRSRLGVPVCAASKVLVVLLRFSVHEPEGAGHLLFSFSRASAPE